MGCLRWPAEEAGTRDTATQKGKTKKVRTTASETVGRNVSAQAGVKRVNLRTPNALQSD